MRLRILAVGGTIVLALAGCAGGHAHASPTTTSPTPTTVAINPDVVPPVITVPYVNAVLKVLNGLNGDAIRELVRSDRLTPGGETDLRAAYNDPLYAQELTIAQQSLAGGLGNVRKPPGNRVTTVLRLLTASPTCIFASTSTSYSAVLVRNTPPAGAEFYRLSPKQDGADPDHLNPTPWAFSFNATYQTAKSIPDQCPARS